MRPAHSIAKAPLLASHSMTRPAPPAMRLPSGEKASPLTLQGLAPHSATDEVLSASHTLTAFFRPRLAIRVPSAEIATASGLSESSLTLATRLPERTFQ